MATLSYTFVSRCNGGGHFHVDVALNGGAAQRVTYSTDEVRASLGQLTDDERQAAALIILKLHFAGMTRNQMVAAFQSGPVEVTI
jgi:hypothetical protein